MLPKSRFQVPIALIFDKKAYQPADVKEFYSSHMRDAFKKFKLKQIYAIEDLVEWNIESDFYHAIENVEINGSGWANDRIASMTIDFYKNVTTGGSSYNAIPMKY